MNQNMASGLPEGCFRDMRGFTCPKPRDREKWRFAHDYQIHVQYDNESDVGASWKVIWGSCARLGC